MKTIVIKTNGTISDLHRANLENELKVVQTRCTARTINTERIIDCIVKAEKYLRELSTVSDMIGTKIFADINAQDFPSAYKYIPESTHFTAERTKAGWKVTDISRDRTRARSRRVEINFTPETKAHMADRLMCMA